MSDIRTNRLQSRVLLPFARIIMLWAAAAAFFVTLGGFAVGVLLYGQSSYVPLIPEPPAPHLDSTKIWNTADFSPEVEFRLVNTDRGRLSVGDTVGVFYSTAPFDPILSATMLVLPLSDRFAVVSPGSGNTSESVTADPSARKFKLTATSKLISDLAGNGDSKTYIVPVNLTFSSDRKEPTIRYNFEVLFADASGVSEGRRPNPPMAEASDVPTPASQSERAAQALALIIDPLRTPLYFTAYELALRQIRSCGGDTEIYAVALNAQIDANRARLKRHNALRFESRACDLWRSSVAEFAEQNAKRQAALAQAAVASLGTRATSMIALYVAGAALATFLMLALALALLAIENHVRHIREESEQPH